MMNFTTCKATMLLPNATGNTPNSTGGCDR